MFRFRLFRNARVLDSSGTGAVALVDVAMPRPKLAKPAPPLKPRRPRRTETIVRLPEGTGTFGRSDYDPFIGRRI